MTSLADRTIDALVAHHEALAELVPNLSDAQLTGPSGASEWTVAQVLSHLGSGAEATLATHRAALNDEPPPAPDSNQKLWDRWDALTPQQQGSELLEHDERLVEMLQALSPDQRERLQIKLAFLPEPVGIATTAGMRLNEVTQHGWDVRVALNPTAGLGEEAASILAEQLSGPLSFMFGFIGKADAVSSPAVVEAAGYGLVIADSVSFVRSPQDATATFDGPLEALLRLIAGRLTPEHTPASVAVSGNITLDDLRRVFPGY